MRASAESLQRSQLGPGANPIIQRFSHNELVVSIGLFQGSFMSFWYNGVYWQPLNL